MEICLCATVDTTTCAMDATNARLHGFAETSVRETERVCSEGVLANSDVFSFPTLSYQTGPRQ